jgi:hypothetical protein
MLAVPPPNTVLDEQANSQASEDNIFASRRGWCGLAALAIVVQRCMSE